MYAGTLTLEYDGKEYDLGYLTKYRENFSKTSATTPIPTKGSDNTYAIESGGKMSVSLELQRKNPANGAATGTDSTRWTNAYWYSRISEIVDIWQARKDGYILKFTPSHDNPYTPEREFRGYIKSFSREIAKGSPEIISVNVEFVVGTRYVSTNTSNSGTKVTDFQISMSNADGSAWYTLLSGDAVNCIEAYDMEGGMEQPFESITLSIPKNRLTTVAPDLVDNIVPGYSKMVVRAVGKSRMTVVKCKLSNKTYKITAYCDAEAIKGYNLTTESSFTPWFWIKYILTSGEFGFTFSLNNDEDGLPSFIYSVTPKEEETDELTFKKDTNVWYILQVCAMYLGCKVFFANNKAYCIDCRGKGTQSNVSDALKNYSIVNLYTYDTSDPIYGRTTGSVSLGDEGIDTVINSQSVECKDDTGANTTATYTEGKEVIRAGNTLYATELIEGGDYSQGKTLAKNVVEYRREPQQSVTFTLKELQSTGSTVTWAPFFQPASRAEEITSLVDDFTVTNESVDTGVRLPQKLLLSQYERHYPEGTTTYTFGTIANVDLAVSTSQIVTNQSNGGA